MAKTVDQLRMERLQAQVAELEQFVRFRAATGSDAGEWRQYAERSLEAAKNALAGGKEQSAWAHCKQGFRFLYYSMDRSERRQRAQVLRREAEEKLKNWRKDAVGDILGRGCDSQKTPTGSDLDLAQFVLDQNFDNMYFKLEVLATRARVLIRVLGLLVAAALIASVVLNREGANALLYSYRTTGLVMLLGAVGAVLSNTLSGLSTADRIPQMLRGWTEGLVRPLVGALSAMVVVVIVQSGLLPIKPPANLGDPMLYAYAVAAGFTDKLLNRVMLAMEKSVEK